MKASLRFLVAATVAVFSGACTTPVPPVPTPPAAKPVRPSEPLVLAPRPLSPEEMRDYRGARASRMIGAPVIDNRGQPLGRLQEILIDTRTGFIGHAVVARVQPAREPLLRVPVRLLRVTDKAVVVDADGLAQPVYIVPPAATPGIHRASSLMDKRVDDVSGREVGRITDVVIDLSRQKVHYTVLDFNPQSGFSTALAYAVPIESLIIRGAEPDRIALAVPQQRLAGLAGFDASRWPELNDPRHLATIERSFGTLVPRRGAVGGAR